jgi:NAD kinase
MQNGPFEKIVLVTRQTRLEELIARFNTKAQARFYIEHSGGDFSLYEREHRVYETAVAHLRRGLQKLARFQLIERQFLPNFLFSQSDLVVTIGIDGLVVNTAKYLDGQPIVAVNPDPDHIDGVLLPFTVDQAPAIVAQALSGEMQLRPISMAEARLNDGQRLLAFNDLFIGRHDHVSARYRLQFQKKWETHSSSGIIVSTGAGSTGWLSSLFNMANGMFTTFAGPGQPLDQPSLAWEAEKLLFVVREPFVSQTSAANIVCGAITGEAPLHLESTMPDGGVIFSDGVTADFLSFNAGTTATISLAQRKTNLVVGER